MANSLSVWNFCIHSYLLNMFTQTPLPNTPRHTLVQLTQIPIPLHSCLPQLESYRTYPVVTTHPDSQEPLMNALAAGLPGRSIYAETDGWNAPYHQPIPGAPNGVWVRKTVLEKLERINHRLAEIGLELYLLDGFRTIQCQQGIYNWMKATTEKAYPYYSQQQVKEHLRNFISDPSNFNPLDSTTWTSHITGGAIDLTLRHKASATLLEMGGVFDDPSPISFTSYYENLELPQAHSATHAEARRNRRLLYHMMRTEHFTSLPAEWWHFDFGDQLWARNNAHYTDEFSNQQHTAFYGPAQLKE